MNTRKDLVLSCLISKLPHFKRIYCKFSTDIEIFADYLIGIIEDFSEQCIEMDENYTLIYNETEDFDETLQEDQEVQSDVKRQKIYKSDDENDYNYEPETTIKKNYLEDYYTFERMLDFEAECKEKSRSYVAKKYKKSLDEINAICARVKKGPSEEYKMIQLKSMLLSKFNEARSMGIVIKDDSLRRWCCEIKHQLNFEKINCSSNFIEKFKKQNKIVSRRITHFVTKKKLDNHEQLVESSKVFVEKINDLIDTRVYETSNIFNADQSKIEYEMTTKRTLSSQGEKDTIATVININATTHAFTIQPIISRDGTLHFKLFVVFQENEGVFGPAVAKEVLKLSEIYKNLVILPSKSGKFDKKITNFWYEKVFKPATNGKKSLLLVDSFSCHKSQCSDTLDNSNYNIQVEIIPPGTTSMIQPLDVFFFRQFKLLYRKLIDEARILKTSNNSDFIPHKRSFQIKCLSLTHQQFTAPIFQPMIKGAWNLSGYSLPDNELIEKFDAAIQILFSFSKHICENCSNATFIRCAFCRLNLCFNCFLSSDNLHHHFDNDLEPSILDYYGLDYVKKSKKKSNLEEEEFEDE